MKRIPLTQRKYAVIDDTSFVLVSQYKWFFDGAYAARRENGKKIYMHRLICNTPENKETDHINGDKLDNKCSNLRVCDRALNNLNHTVRSDSSSGFKGVSFMEKKKKWRAYFNEYGKQIHLGLFLKKEEAAEAYNSFAIGRGYKIKLNLI